MEKEYYIGIPFLFLASIDTIFRGDILTLLAILPCLIMIFLLVDYKEVIGKIARVISYVYLVIFGVISAIFTYQLMPFGEDKIFGIEPFMAIPMLIVGLLIDISFYSIFKNREKKLRKEENYSTEIKT